MAKKDPRVDAYIGQAAPFARPILKHLRKIVHAGCPQAEETMKWNMPHFDYKGLFCGMAAFKKHCAFGFWKEAELALPSSLRSAEGMGHFGCITAKTDLPDEKTLLGYVRKAVEIKDAGVKKPSRKKAGRSPLRVPDYLRAALGKNKKARETFAKLSPSARRDYVEWLTEAKREETRQCRLATAVKWLAQGKARNWKYAAC